MEIEAPYAGKPQEAGEEKGTEQNSHKEYTSHNPFLRETVAESKADEDRLEGLSHEQCDISLSSSLVLHNDEESTNLCEEQLEACAMNMRNDIHTTVPEDNATASDSIPNKEGTGRRDDETCGPYTYPNSHTGPIDITMLESWSHVQGVNKSISDFQAAYGSIATSVEYTNEASERVNVAETCGGGVSAQMDASASVLVKGQGQSQTGELDVMTEDGNTTSFRPDHTMDISRSACMLNGQVATEHAQCRSELVSEVSESKQDGKENGLYTFSVGEDVHRKIQELLIQGQFGIEDLLKYLFTLHEW